MIEVLLLGIFVMLFNIGYQLEQIKNILKNK
jgi:hypothetical protein